MAEQKAKDFFSEEEKLAIRDAIVAAEKNTSGEIRVHMENHCKGDAVKHAEKVFARLGMQKTGERNGVLFYLAVLDRTFVIYGDVGIHDKVKDDFWDSVRDHMLPLFKQGHFCKGLCEGIHLAGAKLCEHFPHRDDDVDELSNDVSFS
ncbi:MAG TPA: TPM domain-containing protein [Bacteroidia bacterium]|jgi:uncharacterized membrane protein|nr:TPM domain-containing protein [Bacteroidia bacterium]